MSSLLSRTSVWPRRLLRVRLGAAPTPGPEPVLTAVFEIDDAVVAERRVRDARSLARLRDLLDQPVLIRLFVAEDPLGGVCAVLCAADARFRGAAERAAPPMTRSAGEIAGAYAEPVQSTREAPWTPLGIRYRHAEQRVHKDSLSDEARSLLHEMVPLLPGDVVEERESAVDALLASLDA